MKNLNFVEKEILDWTHKFPVDKWWREKHRIPFMSAVHQEISFLDQLFEYYEDKLIERVFNKKEEYIPNTGDFLRGDEISDIEKLRAEFERDFLNG